MNNLFQQEGYDLMAAAFEVYNEMGHGFLEPVFQECLERELASRQIPHVAQKELTIHYKGIPLQQKYRIDLLVHDGIVVELKAVKALLPEHRAQLINYLKATKLRVGYLINYGCPDKLDWERIVL
jgi:GxxExxY protein